MYIYNKQVYGMYLPYAVCMYVRTCVCMYGRTDRQTDGRTYVCMYACVYVCVLLLYNMCVRMHVVQASAGFPFKKRLKEIEPNTPLRSTGCTPPSSPCSSSNLVSNLLAEKMTHPSYREPKICGSSPRIFRCVFVVSGNWLLGFEKNYRRFAEVDSKLLVGLRVRKY
jgi:hypothetical protein